MPITESRGAGHAKIAHVCGAAGQHAGIGGGDMGMSADDGADSAIEIPSESLFFGGGFGVEIDQDNVGNLTEFGCGCGDAFVSFTEWAIDWWHEYAPLKIEYHGVPVHQPTATRSVVVVGRPQQRQLVHVGQYVFLVPDVIARRHHIDTGIQKVTSSFQRKTETAGGVLRVSSHEVYVQLGSQLGQEARQGTSPWPADYVANHQDSHVYSRR